MSETIENHRWREVAVTLSFTCHTQEEYDERMTQVRGWIDGLRQITGDVDGSIHIQLEP